MLDACTIQELTHRLPPFRGRPYRHKFVKEKLDYAPSTQEAYKYLKEAHAEFLPEESELAITEQAATSKRTEGGRKSESTKKAA